jgi:signal transduction histidine kinase
MRWLTTRPEPPAATTRWAALAVLVLFAAIGAIRTIPDHAVLGELALAVVIAAGVATVLGPPGVALGAGIAAAGGVVALGDGHSSNLAFFGLVVLIGWWAISEPAWVTGLLWAAMIAVYGLEWTFADNDPGWGAWVGGTTFAAVACVVGRRQRDLLVQLRAAQDGLERRAQAEERTRIARELHDVIGHSLTVSLMHVSSARLALDEDREAADRALAEAERLGRASLDEVRHAVGLLRRPDGSESTAPLPGGADIDELVTRFRTAGAHVVAVVDDEISTVPRTVGLATYRIVQESLTNAVKHAPGAPVELRVAVGPEAVQLSVDSAGPPRTGSGLGLVGMRERAESIGGTCAAGPGGSGWLVRAELPLRGER